ncbi:MAG: MmcB family DNA repair protein [Pseudomonadota bacterium]
MSASAHLYMRDAAEFSSDGRQSETALAIRRGTQRLLSGLGYAAVAEATLANGRRADLAAIGPHGEIWIIEIKSSAADLAADGKWPDYEPYCDRLSFATLPALCDLPFPEQAGLIAADAHGGEELRSPSTHPLSAARRKAMLIRLSMHAARRLSALEDPLAGF